jgi:hypothetical protein
VTLPRLFIGSSGEGGIVAHNLQAVLEARKVCEVKVWDQGVFEPSGYALDSLLEVAARSDYAVLVATPDDVTTSRGTTNASVRDNIILEFGLFLGVLGRNRTYLLATTGDVKLPTDALGLMRLQYSAREDGHIGSAVNAAALEIAGQVKRHGLRQDSGSSGSVTGNMADESRRLELELALLCANAEAQGWTVKTSNATTLRLVPPGRKNAVHTLSKRDARTTREQLREFVAKLRADGLRVNSAIRFAPEDSPL